MNSPNKAQIAGLTEEQQSALALVELKRLQHRRSLRRKASRWPGPVILLALALAACSTDQVAKKDQTTFSSFDQPTSRAAQNGFAPGLLQFRDADATAVLAIYQELSGRTVIRPSSLPAVKISATSQGQLSRVEALQFLDTLLAQNGITMVLLGDSAVKAVAAAQAPSECPPVIDLPLEALPESSSYMTRIVRLHKRWPSEVVPMLQPLAKMPNGIIAINDAGLLILRDYSVNIRQMLRVLRELEGE